MPIILRATEESAKSKISNSETTNFCVIFKVLLETMQTSLAYAISAPASSLFTSVPFLTTVNIRMAPTGWKPVAEEYEYYQVLGGARINIYAFIHQPVGL